MNAARTSCGMSFDEVVCAGEAFVELGSSASMRFTFAPNHICAGPKHTWLRTARLRRAVHAAETVAGLSHCDRLSEFLGAAR